MSLEEEIATKAKEISTEFYAMSVGELLNLDWQGEIDHHSEFRRFFRGTDQQKSRRALDRLAQSGSCEPYAVRFRFDAS
jgi:hypothetical protein